MGSKKKEKLELEGTSSPQNHHFVPKSYLRRWAPSKQKCVIDVYHLPTRSVLRGRTPEHVAAELGFYEVPAPNIERYPELAGADTNVVEDKQFGKIDDVFARTSDSFIKAIQSGRSVDCQLKSQLAHALAVQQVRTPLARASMKPYAAAYNKDAAIQSMLEENPALKGTPTEFALRITPPEVFREKHGIDFASESGLKLFHFNVLFKWPTVVNFQAAFDRLRWRVLINGTDTSFFSSDQPLIYPLDRLGGSVVIPKSKGYGCPALVYPVSPSILLLGYREDGAPQSSTDVVVEPLADEVAVDRFNQVQFLLASKYVIVGSGLGDAKILAVVERWRETRDQIEEFHKSAAALKAMQERRLFYLHTGPISPPRSSLTRVRMALRRRDD